MSTLPEIVNEMRDVLRNTGSAYFDVVEPGLPDPVRFELVSDGATAILVTVKCGERTIVATGHTSCYDRAELTNGLFAFVKQCIAAAKEKPIGPS